MISAPALAGFLLASLVIILIPGPSVLFAIGRALSLGRRAAVLSVVGNAGGTYLQSVAVSLGLGLLLTQSELLMTVIRLVGAAFLVYLGVQSIRHRNAALAPETALRPRSARRSLAEGFIVGVTNPKTSVFFLAILPQFADPTLSTPLGVQMWLLGTIFVAIGVTSDACYALAAGVARDWFARSPGRMSAFGVAGGVAMMCLGVGLALSGLFE